jgi:DinB superfamily
LRQKFILIREACFGAALSSHPVKIIFMIGRPSSNEVAPYYFGYINRVSSDDILHELQSQLDETLPFLRGITEEKSLYRYAPEKWSIRQMWGHVNDTERVFLMRALWFARNFDTPMPSFDQDIAVAAAASNDVSWARHIEEFREIRLATLSFFRNLPEEAWTRKGIASGNPFTVRACAYIVAGHPAHHAAVLREKYL